MSQLLDLAPELLLLTFSHLFPPELSSLVYSCRQFNELATPLLYHSVYFHDFRNAENFPFKGVRIWNLASFTRSCRTSMRLCALVRCVDIRWYNTYERNVDDDVHQCPRALHKTSLRSLHLSPPGLFFNIPSGTPITSLAVRRVLRDKWDPKTYVAEFDRIYELFSIQSLTHFSLDGWHNRNKPPYDGPLRVRSDRVGHSNVKSLTLDPRRAPGEDVQEILSWPKALKSFSMKAHEDGPACYEPPINNENYGIQYLLDHQRENLIDLKVKGRDSFGGPEPIRPITLIDYTKLKRLSIRVDFLTVPSHSPRVRRAIHLHERLPAMLEELRLDATEMMMVRHDERVEAPGSTQDFLNVLLDIVAARSFALPMLKSVGHCPPDIPRRYDGKYETRYQEVVYAYEEAKVDFYGYSESIYATVDPWED